MRLVGLSRRLGPLAPFGHCLACLPWAGLLLDVGSAAEAGAELSQVQPATPQQSAVLALLQGSFSEI